MSRASKLCKGSDALTLNVHCLDIIEHSAPVRADLGGAVSLEDEEVLDALSLRHLVLVLPVDVVAAGLLAPLSNRCSVDL